MKFPATNLSAQGVFLALGALVAVPLALTSFHTVDQDERGVILRMGTTADDRSVS